jgi:hypothetical protein
MEDGLELMLAVGATTGDWLAGDCVARAVALLVVAGALGGASVLCAEPPQAASTTLNVAGRTNLRKRPIVRYAFMAVYCTVTFTTAVF